MQSVSSRLDIPAMVDNVHRLYDNSMELVNQFSIPGMHFEFETINPNQFRLIHLDMPRVGEWDQIYMQIFGNILSYNKYLELYPTFIKNHSATKKLIFPSNDYMLHFGNDNDGSVEVTKWPVVKDTSMYQDRTIIHTPILLKILNNVYGVLENIKSVYDEHVGIRIVR